MTDREEASQAGSTKIKTTGLVLNKRAMRLNLKSKLAFGAVPSHSELEKFSGASSSVAFQADSREIMQYLQGGNLISSLRPIHSLLITSPGVSGRRAGWGRFQRDRAQNTALAIDVLQ